MKKECDYFNLVDEEAVYMVEAIPKKPHSTFINDCGIFVDLKRLMPEIQSVMKKDNENIDTITLINNIAYNYVGITLCGIGIFGNILNLIVLTRPKLKGKLTVKEFSLPVFFYILYHHKTQIRSIL